jgi:Type II CAAX prenyl endopeptidase Rce1-like
VTRIRRRARLPANLGAAAALAGFARASGASPSELGLSRANAGRGKRFGLVAAVPLAAASAAAVANPRTRRLLADDKITGTSPGEAVFETLVRIPLETALSEEVIFRGVLLGLGSRSRSRGWALVTSSMLFGLWHAESALASPERSATSRPDARATTSTAAVVATTATRAPGSHGSDCAPAACSLPPSRTPPSTWPPSRASGSRVGLPGRYVHRRHSERTDYPACSVPAA